MRIDRRMVPLVLLAAALVACSTTKESERKTVSKAKTGPGAASGGALAESVCQRSIEIFTNHRVQYVGGGKAVPDQCRSVRVDETKEGLIATVEYHGDPVPWRFRVERGSAGSGSEAELPGLAKALESSPEKVRHQRAADLGVYLKSWVIDYYKGPGGGTFPSSIEDLKQLEQVGAIPNDPWGHPYLYSTTGNRFELVSPGPDGRTGTEDDVDADSTCVGGARSCLEVLHVY